MSGRLELSDAGIETMLARRAHRADPDGLASIALEAVRRAPARSARPWDRLSTSPRLVPGSARWFWVGIAAMLALALVGGLLAAGAWRLPKHPYPLLTGNPTLSWMSRAVSGDELWTMDGDGLWHYVGDAWQGPLSPPPLDGEMVSGLALGPDGALWVAGATTVAVLREGAWRAAWSAAPSDRGLGGLAVGPDGTVWAAQGRELVALRPAAAGYSARSVTCPTVINRLAATTDGTIYVGGFMYAGGKGLARSDGAKCGPVDPLGDGQVHEVADVAAGPGGSLLATVFDEDGGACCRVWVTLLRDGRWSTISGPTVESGVSLWQAIAPDGHPWRIDGDLGLERYEGGVWRVVAASARSMAMAPDGVLWYMTDRGIERIRTDEFGG